MVLQSGEKTGFAESVDLNQLDVRESLPCAPDQLGRDRRAAVADDFEAGEVVLFEVRNLRHQADHRRHQYGVADPLTFDRLTEVLCAELRDGDLAGAKGRRAE